MSGSRRQYPFHLIEPKWQQTRSNNRRSARSIPAKCFRTGIHFPNATDLRAKPPAQKTYRGNSTSSTCSLPVRRGLARRHPEGYRYGHSRPLPACLRFQRAASDGLGLVRPACRAIRRQDRPASRVTTEANIANFTRQIKSLGFSYDWSREIATTDVDYFKWTQWIFLKLYNSWLSPETNKA